MAKIFKIVNPSADQAMTWPGGPRTVASGAVATIARGTPTKESSGSVAIMADGEGTTTERFSGIAKNTSTDTVAAAGVVQVFFPLPGVIYAGSPKTAGSANTQAKIDAFRGNRVVFDLTSTNWTIDTAAVDAIGNAVVIVGGQPEEDSVWFVVTHTSLNFFENN